MTLPEFRREFQTKYDMSSMGAPSLNDYEISLFLTQSVRDLINEIYQGFEHTEYRKRGLGPLIQEEKLNLEYVEDYFESIGIKAFEATLPDNLWYMLQENTKLKGITNHVEVKPDDLDEINKTVENPFRAPNRRRILRTEIGSKRIRLYSKFDILNYKVKFIKKYTPIILTDFKDDADLMGDETIDGKYQKSMTELPEFLHDKIVDRAVIIAIRSLRENNLKTQIEV